MSLFLSATDVFNLALTGAIKLTNLQPSWSSSKDYSKSLTGLRTRHLRGPNL